RREVKNPSEQLVISRTFNFFQKRAKPNFPKYWDLGKIHLDNWEITPLFRKIRDYGAYLSM
ncbi:hypothetical protein KAT45_03650, partial [Candidatus Aerophobetes bacterium]|nr:hypothetical protein [Candidatus Aerophobetes bacterium]